MQDSTEGYEYCPKCGRQFDVYQEEYEEECAQCELEDNAFKIGD